MARTLSSSPSARAWRIWTTPGLLGFVQNLVELRVPLYLTLHYGKAEGSSVFLNNILGPPVRARDGAGFIAILARQIEKLQPAG